MASEARQVPDLAATMIGALTEHASEVQGRIRQLERNLLARHCASGLARRIAIVPGVGLLGATALAATVTDPTYFHCGGPSRGLARTDAAQQLRRRQGAARARL